MFNCVGDDRKRFAAGSSELEWKKGRARRKRAMTAEMIHRYGPVSIPQ